MDYEGVEAYIWSLEAASDKATEQEWRDWIKYESDDLKKQSDDVVLLTDNEIEYVIERLREDGFIKED